MRLCTYISGDWRLTREGCSNSHPLASILSCTRDVKRREHDRESKSEVIWHSCIIVNCDTTGTTFGDLMIKSHLIESRGVSNLKVRDSPKRKIRTKPKRNSVVESS